MTTGNPQRSVLLIGASQRVLDEAVAGLRRLGYIAQATNDFLSDITGRFDFTQIDLVTLGGRIPPNREAELKEQIGAINPRITFIGTLAGIPGLIVSQVQEAFSVGHQEPAHTPTCIPGDHSIRLALADPAVVKVTVYWRTSIVPPDPKSDSLVLLDDRLAGGHHAIPIPDHVFRPPMRSPNSPNLPPAAFATVQVDEAIYNFSVAAGQ